MQSPCLYRHPLEIQPYYVISVYVATDAKIEFCVKLDMMPTQTNVKVTAARMKVNVEMT